MKEARASEGGFYFENGLPKKPWNVHGSHLCFGMLLPNDLERIDRHVREINDHDDDLSCILVNRRLSKNEVRTDRAGEFVEVVEQDRMFVDLFESGERFGAVELVPCADGRMLMAVGFLLEPGTDTLVRCDDGVS